MENQIIKRVSTGAEVKAVLPATEAQATYPADGIADGAAPLIIIEFRDLTASEIKQMILAGIQERRLDADIVVRYLCEVVQHWDEINNNEVWTSFGIELAKIGQAVNPLSLLRVRYGKRAVPDFTVVQGQADIQDKALEILLLGIYRVASITNDAYKTRVMDAIQQQALEADPKVQLNIGVLAGNKHLLSNPNYLRMVAAIDMFFYRFKESERANVRVSTLTSRFKDCAALSTFAHVASFTGLTLSGVLDWVFTETVAAEVERMMKPGQEIDQEASYMPYLKDMGLSKVSPYSATKNPGFHTWGQSACALMGSIRSQNALRASEDNWLNLKLNAEIMAFALGTSAELVKAFDIGGNTDDQDDGGAFEGELNLAEDAGMPKKRDAMEWFMYMEGRDFKLTEDMKEGLRRMAGNIKNPRPGTIGDLLKHQAL
nr:nucleocapsid protein [Snakehead vesiculovirus]